MPVTQILSTVGRGGSGGPPPFEPTDSGQSLGVTWTVEVVADLTFVQSWAVLWGNENYNAGLGHFAYFGGTTTLSVGSPNAMNEYTVPDLGVRAYWVFTHADGGGVSVYRNGVLLTPYATNYIQSTPASNTLLWGSRHNNDGTGFTDTLPGTYLYTNIRNTALDAAGVVSAYNALSGTYGFTPILGQYTFNGTPTDWATTNATVATYGAYTYPDGTSGSLHTLTGSQYLMSGNIGNNTVLNINLWFYPTANNLVIMGEMGQPAENSSWHYSMLDIDNTNHLKGRLWEFVGVTSTGTVTLNAWNHAYLYYNSVTGYVGMSLNNETAVTTNTGSRHTSDTSETYLGIGVFDSQNMSSSTRYQGKFDGLVIDTTLTGSNYSSTKAKYYPPLSLEFVENQGDYLEAAGSSDWNLGDTWTIEFYLNANAASVTAGGGIWGLLNQVGWSTTDAIVVALSDNKLVYLSRAWNANDDVRYTEPTPGQWTHVAIANDAGTQKVFYNGAEQTRVSGNVGSASYTNGSSPLRIGRLGPANGGTLNGKMALVRISNTAKYTAPFTPTTTYGVEADTKLFLSLTTPLVDSKSHTITNNGVTTSINVPT